MLCRIAFNALRMMQSLYDSHEDGHDTIQQAINNVNLIAMDLMEREDW